MNTWGDKLRLSIFGESHGKGIGIVIDGLPSGEEIDMVELEAEMARRAPGGALATPRKESDVVEVLSGLLENRTTGAPVCGLIRNSDTRSGDYNTALRPGHADWTALVKYGGYADGRGGGHFSGRLTAPLVFAGAIAKQLLARRGISVFGRIAAIAGIKDTPPDCDLAVRQAIAAKPFPVCDTQAGEQMQVAIRAAGEAGDSVGGIAEAVVYGIPAGLGEPFFGSVESKLASLLFSIPAVKGVEFGSGFELAQMKGSQANDQLCLREGDITATSNHNGGILGGITNGMPLVVRAAFKPTPSIALEQDTVDGATMQEIKLKIKGRHDPCIVPRALPVVETAAALCVLDCMLLRDDRLFRTGTRTKGETI